MNPLILIQHPFQIDSSILFLVKTRLPMKGIFEVLFVFFCSLQTLARRKSRMKKLYSSFFTSISSLSLVAFFLSSSIAIGINRYFHSFVNIYTLRYSLVFFRLSLLLYREIASIDYKVYFVLHLQSPSIKEYEVFRTTE